MNFQFFDKLSKISAANWSKCNKTSTLLTSYQLFKAFEDSQSACVTSGWQPHHLVMENKHGIQGIMPLYIKQHSWGEYVFDWDWADAFHRNNIAYYPKLVSTIPFTPITSNKLLSEHRPLSETFNLLTEHCLNNEINSWHVLYCAELPVNQIKKLPNDVYQRNTVQFHWFNRDYQSFDDFVDTFTSRKRKNTRKERLSMGEQGLQIRRIKGSKITQQELAFFYLSYQTTYLKKGHQPHLNADFFEQLITNLADNVLLIIASHQGNDVACALFFYDHNTLYGRYWGCVDYYANLHFELCYYQGIEFCIEKKLKQFNPGTQGEHKIQRGFEPVLTYSYHWIKHQAFKQAIKDFCHVERQQMEKYRLQCQQALPFKNKSSKT
ncbi:MAG: GNAT family N-acetyltransferase [Gammaproteobacteria bacterium]|nr:MAG: GNAT family N-acetyltransferase [Gammaproteobacteria bacterium]